MRGLVASFELRVASKSGGAKELVLTSDGLTLDIAKKSWYQKG